MLSAETSNSVSMKPDLSNTLYRDRFERDNCGFGLIAHMDGEASHALVTTAINSLARMTHRGAIAADGKTGDGCGLLIRKPDAFLRAVAASAETPQEAVWDMTYGAEKPVLVAQDSASTAQDDETVDLSMG